MPDNDRPRLASGLTTRGRLASSSSFTPSYSAPRMGAGRKISGFFLSTLESFPELFGIEPSRATQEFRAVAPVSGFLSQAAGAFVPYLGAARLARAAPVAGRFIRGAENLGRGALSRGALGLGAEAAVVEAGRVGLAASPLPSALYEGVTGREAETRSLPTLLGEAAFNIGGSAVLGGAAGGIVDRLRRGVRIHDLVPEAAPDQPLTVQARALNEYVRRAQAGETQVDEALLARVARERDNRVRMILGDIEPQFTTTGEAVASNTYRSDQGRLFRRIEGERRNRGGDGQTSSFLNRLARWNRPAPDKLTDTRRLIYTPNGKGGFSNEDALADVLTRIGMTREDLALFAQDVRVVRVKTGTGNRPRRGAAPEPTEAPELPRNMTPGQAAGQRLQTSAPKYSRGRADPALSRARGIESRFMHKSFADVGEGWRMAREADGLYVMAKKIEGEIGNPQPGDQWAFLRTDRPDIFAPRAARSSEVFNRSAYLPEPIETMQIGEPLWDEAVRLQQTYAPQEVLAKKTATRLGAAGSALRESGETFASVASPSNPLVYRNPLLARSFRLIKDLEAAVETRVDRLMRGERTFEGGKSLVRNFLDLDPPQTEGLEAFIKTLSKEDLDTIRFVLETETPYDELKRLYDMKALDAEGNPLISEGAFNFLTGQQAISDAIVKRAEKLDGMLASSDAVKLLENFQARRGHYGLTREFPGSFRIFLNDANGEVVGIASGKSVSEAREAAQDLIASQAKRGRELTEGGLMDETLLDADRAQRLRAAVLRPGFLKNRGDLLGYEIQRGELTPDKLSKLVEKNLRRRENWLKEAVMREMLSGPMATLGRQSPTDADVLKQLIQRSVGDEGAFGKVQNALMDKALHVVGFSGHDSASQIAKTGQQLLYSFQMMFGNIVHPILNGIGFFQTVLPEVAYIVHGNPAMLARNYVSLPLVDGNNNIAGTLGVLSEVKLLGRALKRLGSSWDQQDPEFRELVQRLVADRTLAPRYAEEQFGANGAILKNLTEGFRDTQSFVKLANSANEILLSKTEELNRIAALSTAYELGTVQGLSGDRMTIFAREFLAKTAFNYGTVDRAKMFTTPLGSLMGTFKNWIFHYMANMVRYGTDGKDALPALMWQTATTALVGGAAATPLVMPVADAFAKWATDRTAMEFLYNSMEDNEWVADGLMYGLPGMMGLSLASQASAPGSDPARDASMLFSFAAWDRVKALSGATRDALNTWNITGENPFEDERVRMEMARALAPRTIYRAMAVAENTAVHSMATGYQVTAPLGLGGAALYAAGFNATELEKTYEVYNTVRDSQERNRALVAEYGQTLAQAWESGDTRLANRVFARAMATGVDTSSVLRSAKARQSRMEETQLEFTADAQDRERFGFMF